MGENFLFSTYNSSFLAEDSAFKFWENVRNVRQSIADVVIVICLKTNEATFQAIEYIGNNSVRLSDPRRIWISAVWPTAMNSHQDIKAISKTEGFISAIKHYQINSNLFFAFSIDSSVAIYETYIAGNHTTFKFLPDGIILWSCKTCQGPTIRRFNFHERVLKITAVNDSEVNDDIHVYEDSNGTITYSKDGLSGSILQILQQMLNFTIEPMMSREFGSPIPGTGRWTGSIGELIDGKADLGIAITIFQPERAKVVSFLPPADEHLINAFFQPSDVNSIRDIFAQPFKLDLWAAVVVTWVVLATFMIIFSLIRKRYGMDIYDGSGTDNANSEEPDFTKDSFMWALGTACQQGWDEHPKAGSLRTIFISGSFTGVIAYAGYSAAIVSTLSLRVDPIKNPMELLRSNLRMGIRKGFISSLLEQNGTHDTMSLFNKRLEKSKEYERYLNVSAGFNYLLKHPYAFITTRDTIYDLMKFTAEDKVICGIKDLPLLKYGFPIGYPVPKSSPFKEILRYAMIMIREPGVLWRLRMKYSFQRRCLEASDNAGYALGPNDVFTAYMILLGGFALSITFLVIEKMIPLHQFSYVR
ncbi:unnamed protein product [Orchesella dallaii]